MVKSSGDVRGKKSSVVDELAALKDQWSDVEEAAGVDVPDGKYVAQVKEAVVNKSKASGRLQVSWQLVIAEGDYRGRYLFKHDGMDDEVGLGYLRAGLARLGIEWPSDPSELPELLESAQGTFCEVKVRTKEGSDFTNTYFIRALPDYEGEEVETETEETEETETVAIKVGMTVTADYDGTEYKGKVTAVDEAEETADVEFEDETEDTLAWSELTVAKPGKSKAAAEPEEEEEAEFEVAVGSRVVTEIDGEQYAGKVTKLKGDQAVVKFDDGDVQTIDISELSEESAEEAEEEETEEVEEETETEEVTGAEVTFDDEAITPILKKKIDKMAKAAEIEASEYDSMTDLLVDLADLAGVTGEFKNPAKMIQMIEAAQE